LFLGFGVQIHPFPNPGFGRKQVLMRCKCFKQVIKSRQQFETNFGKGMESERK
jgi:hypothetical protein